MSLTPPDNAPPVAQASPWRAAAFALRRSVPAAIGLGLLIGVLGFCLLSLPFTLRPVPEPGLAALNETRPSSPAFDLQNRAATRLPPFWAVGEADREAVLLAGRAGAIKEEADRRLVPFTDLSDREFVPTPEQIDAATPRYTLGSDHLGRSVASRLLVGGAVSLLIGLAAAALSVLIGTLYGAIAGYAGGVVDGVMMRVVDVLYGLPYVLLVVLLAVAVDGALSRWQQARAGDLARRTEVFITKQLEQLPLEARTDEARGAALSQARQTLGSAELTASQAQGINLATLLVAIGGISWLTMARVVRGQVLSLKAQPFMEAARAVGVPVRRQFTRHLLPNLVGPIVVYGTLMVPQAILQESFLSFLGIGVRPPLPSWGNLAADGLGELNTVHSRWWLLLFPCLMLGGTLLALNFVGEAVREALDPKSAQHRGGKA